MTPATPIENYQSFRGLPTLAGLATWSTLADRGEATVVLRMALLAAVPVVVAFLRARPKPPGKAMRVFLDFYVVGVVNRNAFENVLDRLLRPEAGAMTGLKTFD